MKSVRCPPKQGSILKTVTGPGRQLDFGGRVEGLQPPAKSSILGGEAEANQLVARQYPHLDAKCEQQSVGPISTDLRKPVGMQLQARHLAVQRATGFSTHSAESAQRCVHGGC